MRYTMVQPPPWFVMSQRTWVGAPLTVMVYMPEGVAAKRDVGWCCAKRDVGIFGQKQDGKWYMYV